MNNEIDFEFELKKRFNQEAPELPDSLKKENVIAMLEKNKLQPKKKKKHIFPKILGVAAALIIVVAAATVVPVVLPDKPLVDATTTEPSSFENISEIATTAPQKQENYEIIDNGLKATALKQAQSNEELQKHFLKLYRGNKIDDFFDGIYGAAEDGFEYITDGIVFNSSADMAAPESEMPGMTQAVTSQAVAQNSDNKSGYGNAEESYGQTNVQVENVDEADIIKNDGRYLYILSSGIYNNKTAVSIVDAKNMKVASKLEISEDGYYHRIQEMYVHGDRLVLLANENEKAEPRDEDSKVTYDVAYPYYYGKAEKIVSFVYDISDRENPAFVRKVSQDGARYISSRMIDGVLYALSSYVVRGDSEEEIRENAVPSVNGEHIACDCIYVYDYDSKSYLVLSAYDTKLDNGEVNSLSILGSGDNVYCSRDALYVARTNYDHENGEGAYSDIYAFSLNGTEIAYKASGTVKGNFLNQFSFDEYEGNLRVATTYYSYKHDIDVSSIYVLNKNLELIGALEDIAYDEQVKSVRFIGDTGYIVTFRNTDPLFTLDLSDPTAPKVIGEVKLPGFSSYLHPVGDGLVVGLGYDGDEENADFNTVKVSLFDVSDLKNPKEVDTFVLKNVTSAALYNHKAFIYYPEEKLIGFPVEHYENGTVFSYKLLKIENRVIESHLGYTHKTERGIGTIFRGTYIGDKLYTIDSYRVCEFDIATAAMTGECEILALEDDMPDENIYGDVVTTPAVMPGGVVATTVPSTSPEEDLNGKADTTVGVTGNNAEGTTTSAAYNPVASSTTSAPKGVYHFEALVIKVNDSSVLVEVTAQDDSGLSVGTQVTFAVNAENETFEAGDKLKVSYDGVVQETYPLQISNVFGIERLG